MRNNPYLFSPEVIRNPRMPKPKAPDPERQAKAQAKRERKAEKRLEQQKEGV